MRVVIAPQSLKGSLSAAEAGQAIAAGVRAVYPEAAMDIVPVADGGKVFTDPDQLRRELETIRELCA